MLDDLKMIHERDAQDALGVAEKQPDQYAHSYGFSWRAPRPIRNVVVAGMGGSALAAKAFKVYPSLSVPFEIVQDYNLPNIVTEDTLVVCSSYSGNTEETVSVLNQTLALDIKPMIVVVASGGQLQAMASDNGLPFVQVPDGLQPRYTFGYQYRALAEIADQAGLTNNFVAELESAINPLKEQISQWLPTVATGDNYAKQLAQELMGKSVVIYSGPQFAPVAYKWKISLNENAKAVAWWNTIPEFSHNEFLGWTKHPEQKPYAVVDLRTSFDHLQIQKRFSVSAKLLSGLRPAPITIEGQGDSFLAQFISTIALGDFVSIYLALLIGLNPTPVDLIERFKKELTA